MYDRTQSITGAAAVDLSTTDADYPENNPTRAIYIGVGGNLKVTFADGSVVTYVAFAGQRLPLRVRKIWKTGTTASSLVAEF